MSTEDILYCFDGIRSRLSFIKNVLMSDKLEPLLRMGSWIPVIIVQGIIIFCYSIYMTVTYMNLKWARHTLYL